MARKGGLVVRPVSRINQISDMPSMARAVARETNSGGHIVYLDRTQTRLAKRASLRTGFRAIGGSRTRRDAVLIGFAAWKADGKAKTATSTAAVAILAGVGLVSFGLLGHGGH